MIVPVGLSFEKDSRVAVAPDFHLFQFDVFPLVHRDGSDKGKVNAEASVLAGALQADPYAVRDGHPLGVVCAALEAFLSHKRHVIFDGKKYRAGFEREMT